jgi:mannitol-specific phosphotransferase system IIBC component
MNTAYINQDKKLTINNMIHQVKYKDTENNGKSIIFLNTDEVNEIKKILFACQPIDISSRCMGTFKNNEIIQEDEISKIFNIDII